MTSPRSAGERRVALAAVTGAHGVTGEVRLKLFAQNLDHFAGGATLFVADHPRRLTMLKGQGRAPIAHFEGISDRAAAKALRGSLVEIDRVALPPLGEGEYYHADLIGLPCVDTEGATLGTVLAVENYGAGDLLEIGREGGQRSLIPFRDPIAILEARCIVLDRDFLA